MRTSNSCLRRFTGLRYVCSSLRLHSSGMTLLEVLISILLFAVFMGTFLSVTELIGKWVPSGDTPTGASNTGSCDAPGLELSCIDIALDSIVPALQVSYDKMKPDEFVPIEGVFSSPSDLPVAAAEGVGGWPESYEIKISQFPSISEKKGAPQEPSAPGLYVIIARPKTPAYWRKQSYRLFCRPLYRCISP